MNVTYTESLQKDPKLLRTAEELTETLREIATDSQQDVEATWDVYRNGEKKYGGLICVPGALGIADKREDGLILLLQDSVLDRPVQLLVSVKYIREYPEAVRPLLYRVWGDLLQAQSHKLLQRLQKAE